MHFEMALICKWIGLDELFAPISLNLEHLIRFVIDSMKVIFERKKLFVAGFVGKCPIKYYSIKICW